MKPFLILRGDKKAQQPKTRLEQLEREFAELVLEPQVAKTITGGTKSLVSVFATKPKPPAWQSTFGDDIKI